MIFDYKTANTQTDITLTTNGVLKMGKYDSVEGDDYINLSFGQQTNKTGKLEFDGKDEKALLIMGGLLQGKLLTVKITQKN